ncbi:hypothetical protein [Halorussus salinus]|uniref:hypothetical protein n=1 Tax=Halorussus salinus TaxID=1364935 RepID=UPI001091899D|nr:hypothetical protein [Halorussus salinus]
MTDDQSNGGNGSTQLLDKLLDSLLDNETSEQEPREHEILKSDQRLGRHLETSIISYRQELRRYEVLLDNNQDNSSKEKAKNAIETARRFLRWADAALESGDYLSSLRYFYKSTEEKVYIFKYLDEKIIEDHSKLESFAKQVPQIAAAYYDKDEVKELTESLFNSGELKDDISPEELRSKYQRAYEPVVHELEAITTIKSLLSIFIILLTLFISSFFLLILAAPQRFNDLSCIIGTSGLENCPPNLNYSPLLNNNIFFVLVFLFGLLGSVVNNIRTWSNQVFEISPDFGSPQLSIAFRLVTARILVGGVAAMFFYIVIMSGILSTRFMTTGFILAVAFVAGFSDRLLVAGVNEVLQLIATTKKKDSDDSIPPES